MDKRIDKYNNGFPWLETLDIFAIVGRGLYSDVAPERFGNLAKASFTLFQLITLDDWFFVYSDVVEKYPSNNSI